MDPTGGLRELMDAVKDGKMKAILDPSSPYQMDQFGAMFEKQMSHTAHGKLVLQIKEATMKNGQDGGQSKQANVDENVDDAKENM